LQPFTTHIRLDQYKALIEYMPVRITTSLQSWRQRKLHSPTLDALIVSIAASTTSAVFTIIIYIFHLAVVETITPELIRLPTGEGDKSIVGALALHLEIESDRCGDDGVQLLFAVAE
jgi:hypothetical protein